MIETFVETEYPGKYRGKGYPLFIWFLGAAMMLFSACSWYAPRLPYAHEGVLDAKQMWQQKPGIYSLKGAWMFYPMQLLQPEDISEETTAFQVWVPGFWSEKQFKTFPQPITHGTYHLRLVNHGLPGVFYVRNNDILCAFRVFVNGREVMSGGQPGATKSEEKPYAGPSIARVNMPYDTLDIVIQVSNHHYKDGGIFQALELGQDAMVISDQIRRIGLDVFLAGALLIMAFYYLLLFFVFRNDRASLWFSLFIMVIALRTAVIGQRTLLLWLPDLSWELLIKLEFLTFYTSPIFFALYFQSVFPRNARTWITRVALVGGSLFSLLVVVMPAPAFSRTLPFHQYYIIALGFLILSRAVVAHWKKEEGAGIFLFGAAMIFLAMTHDILQSVLNISGKEIFPAGLLIFIFSQSYVLSRKFSGISKKNEELYKQLEYSKKNLEIVVETRTRELIQQKNLLMETNEELEQQKRMLISQSEAVEEINELLEKEKEKTDELLLNVLPKHIADELKLYSKSLAHSYPLVSVLFVDFVRFSEFSEKIDPGVLLKDLHFYFANFDDVARKYNLEKIKTIGDAYMCAGGLRESADERDVIATVAAALEISQFIIANREDRLSIGEYALECRIGIHTGPVIAGVVGKSKFAFDIWGPTVNIAKRMETACEPGKVNISEDTWEYVKDHFEYTSRGMISMKHKQNMEMFYVDGIKRPS